MIEAPLEQNITQLQPSTSLDLRATINEPGPDLLE